MPEPQIPINLAPVAEAALAVRRHPATIRRWTETGVLKAWHIRPTKMLLVDMDELAELLRPVPRPPTRTDEHSNVGR